MSSRYWELVSRAIEQNTADDIARNRPVIERTAARPLRGDIIRAAVPLTSQDDMREFFEGYVTWLCDRIDVDPEWIKPQDQIPDSLSTRDKAILIAQHNIGWIFGEGLTQQQVDDWVEATRANGRTAQHPSFGTKLPKGPIPRIIGSYS